MESGEVIFNPTYTQHILAYRTINQMLNYREN